MKRACPICDSSHKNQLHTQKFVLPGNQKAFAYQVVGCKVCGFVFADNIPDQKEYDRYYKSNSKYTYNKNIPKGLLGIYENLYRIADQTIKKNRCSSPKSNLRILDVGCSIGTFLNIFKKHGFKHLYGIEPSKKCSLLADELYGIDVFPGLPARFKSRRKFDFIIMSGVLEHVADFNEILPYVSNLLMESGLLMVVVPDAGHFSRSPLSPFDEFSIEHINYFTAISLSNLMKKFGMAVYHSRSLRAAFYDTRILIAFYKKSKSPDLVEKDAIGPAKVERYINGSLNKIRLLEKKFDKLMRYNRKLVVWGVGSLTYRLLASTTLVECKIEAFVDSNASLHGKRINDIKIVSPDYFDQVKNGSVFIASNIYGQEIENLLRGKYHFIGDIIRV